MKHKYVLMVLAVALGSAPAAVQGGKDAASASGKTAQRGEPGWDPVGGRLLADVPESEPANNACPGQAIGCGNMLRPAALTAGDNDYIYFTANAGDVITFGTDADGGPVADTYIHLYNADCSTELAADDDSGPGVASLVDYCATYTGTYVGRIRHYSVTGTGTYRAFVICSPSGDHADVCAGAVALACGAVDLAGHTACSTNDYSPIAAGSGGCTGYTAAGRDQVLRLDVGAGGSVNLTYTSTADGSIYIARACTMPLDGNCVAGADATLAGQPETLAYTFAAAGTYYLILDSYDANSSGAWTLTGTFDCGALTLFASTEGTVYGSTVTDVQGPASSGSLLSSQTFPAGFDLDFNPPAKVSAAQDDLGRSAVFAEGLFAVPSTNGLWARASYRATVVNDNAGARRYVYDFSIAPATLALADYGSPLSPNDPGAPHAGYRIQVLENGQAIFESRAVLAGGRQQHQLTESGTDLGGSYFSTDPRIFGYSFGAYAGRLDLGVFQPGQSFVVEANLLVLVAVGAPEAGSKAAIGDPLDLDGGPGIQGAIVDEPPTDTGPGVAPETFAVRLQAPNPLHEPAVIGFELPVASRVTLDVHDVRGRRLRSLVDGRVIPAGSHSVVWDLHDARGRRVPAGVYFHRFRTPGFSRTVRVVVLN